VSLKDRLPRVVADIHGSFCRLLVEFLAMPVYVCAFVMLAMVCPTFIDLVIVVDHSGCFAAIAGSSGGYFVAGVVGRFYPGGVAAVGALAPSLARCRECVGPLLGYWWNL
jgi:hypothetical protein